jgi:hypothetical protein
MRDDEFIFHIHSEHGLADVQNGKRNDIMS